MAVFTVIVMIFGLGGLFLPPEHGLSIAAEAASSLPAPKGIVVNVLDNQALINWDNVEGAEEYRVYVYDKASKKYKYDENYYCTSLYWDYSFSKTGVNIQGLEPGKTYYFKVAAVKKNGQKTVVGKKSERIKVRTLHKLPLPGKYLVNKDGNSENNAYQCWSIGGERGLGCYNYTPGDFYWIIPTDHKTKEAEKFVSDYIKALKKNGYELKNKKVSGSKDDSIVETYDLYYKGKKVSVFRISYEFVIGGTADTEIEYCGVTFYMNSSR